MPKCMGRITWSKYTHAQSKFGAVKQTCDTRSLKIRNLAKANRASETEEQRKERLRIRVKMIEQEPKKYNRKRERSSETQDWRRLSLANTSSWPWRGRKKKSMTGE